MELSQVIDRIIALAEVCNAQGEPQTGTELSIGSARLSGNQPMTRPPSAEAALLEFLGTLPDAQLNMAAVVMYLGRGDFRANQFDPIAESEQIREVHPSRSLVINMFREKQSSLPEYLREGIRRMQGLGRSIDGLLV